VPIKEGHGRVLPGGESDEGRGRKTRFNLRVLAAGNSRGVAVSEGEDET